jgi:hypothetical protein
MAVDDNCGDFHGSPAFFQPRIRLRPKRPLRVFFELRRLLARINLIEFVLLRSNLENEALAQIPCPDAAGIQFLHDFDGAPHQPGIGGVF